MKSNIKKILSLVLMFIMVLSTAAPAYAATPWETILGWIQSENAAAGTDAYAASNTADAGTYGLTKAGGSTTYVLAGSDFQPTDASNTTGVNLLNSILNTVYDTYTTMDGFLFAGDYDYNYTESAAGKAALQEAVQAKYGTEMHEVYVQGNHDVDSLVGSTLSASGANDADEYGVFVINEKDYMWYNDDEATIQNTAASLETYLNKKILAGYTKPIFVVSHLPLHYCMRTMADGDGQHANYIFDVLNQAGARGLNIFFLFGHNHSHGWDDPYGGAAVFMTKGDTINIAQNSKTVYKAETLNFTYMNAGYIAYYRHVNEAADAELSMTVFAITDTDVTIARYTKDGLHNLQSVGVANTHASTGNSYDGSCTKTHVSSAETYSPDTTPVTSPQTLALNLALAVVEKTDPVYNVTVAAPGISGLTVTKPTVTIPSGYSAYVTYDITPSDYTQGNIATVTIPVDSSFDASRPVVVIDHEGGNTTVTEIVDGTVTFETNHFTPYTIAQSDIEWVEIPGETSYTYTLATNGITANKKYLIVNTNSGTGYALTNSSDSRKTEVSITNSSITVADDTNINWIFSNGSNGTVQNNGTYLMPGNGSLFGTSTNLTIYNRDKGQYRISCDSSGTTYYVKYTNDNWTGASGNKDRNVYLYELTNSVNTATTYAGLAGQVEYNLSTDDYTSSTELLNYIRNNIIVYTADDNAGTNQQATAAYDFNGTLVPTVEGTYMLSVIYDGVTIGTITVHVSEVTIEKIVSVSPAVGSVERGSVSGTATGSTMTVLNTDDSTSDVPVTLAMLSGEYDITKNGTYPNLTVTYGGKTWSGYTLNVVDVSGDNFPEYPNPGSVKVNKIVDATNLLSTGTAVVELSASGLPVQKGADVVVVLDMSSSMTTTVPNTNKTRLQVLKESLVNMLTTFKQEVNGNIPDVDIAIIDFNGYSGLINGARLLGSARDNADVAKVYTGTNGAATLISSTNLSVNHFEKNTELNISTIVDNDMGTAGGTNYDGALLNAYTLLSLKKAANEVERDQYVIFLSDGAPYQYNGFDHGSSYYAEWAEWLEGKWADEDAFKEDYPNNTRSYFYNGNGTSHPHRTAEAIKGTVGEMYNIVLPSAGGNDPAYIESVEGLGATIYSIGFGLANDKNDKSYNVGTENILYTSTMANVLNAISSGTGYCYPDIQTADELNDAFTKIVSEINYAATNARFVDQMGTSFDLQMKAYVNKRVENGTVQETLVTPPSIKVINYDIYTTEDVDDTTVTESMVGARKGTSTILETVTFNTEGTEAYSDKIGGGTQNILIGGVICANSFWYNTNTTSSLVDTDGDGVMDDYLDIDGDGLVDDRLPPETFYWKIGTIKSSELAIQYTVYLVGSMDGDTPAGSYATNQYAILYYDNYLGNAVHKDTTSPSAGWKSANVSYAFYLVDQYGNPVVNQTTGQTGSFYEAVKVTKPVIHQEIMLNNLTKINTIEAISSEILPDGYDLYDKTASYKIVILSEDGKGSWTITADSEKKQSTYVTGYLGTEASNALQATSAESQKDSDIYHDNYDYTHTTVWFAVVWVPKAIPDQVVVDYGLPVDISVLANDQFGINGELVGIGTVAEMNTALTNGTAVGEYTKYSTADSAVFTANRILQSPQTVQNGATAELKYGTAQIVGQKIRYTPTFMAMKDSDQFAYEVKYAYYESYDTNGKPVGEVEYQYYYGTVTVIPATTVYYEEEFVRFTNAKILDENGNATAELVADGSKAFGDWYTDGTAGSDLQAEDRPGQYSLSGMDANYVYGYDGIISAYTKFSLGAAERVSVDKTTGTTKNAPEATFTFTGTGFDVISVTNSDSATIQVSVVNSQGTNVYTKLVNNYYGYTYGEYESATGEKVTGWYTPTEPGDAAVWQVPVIKAELGAWDTYTVTIKVAYITAFDVYGDGYTFWLDSIRVYDPADPNGSGYEDIKDAYLADNEAYPRYKEIHDVLKTQGGLSLNGGKYTTGVVFIDRASDPTATITDYLNPGPNNEVYLAEGQLISFQILSMSDVPPASLQIGAKLAFGENAVLMLNDEEFLNPLDTALDMYYRMDKITWKYDTTLKGYLSDPIVLSNGAGTTFGTNVISLTNIKVTYASNPDTGGQSSGTVNPANSRSSGYSLLSTASAADTTTTETAELLNFVVNEDTLAYANVIADVLYSEQAPTAPEIPAIPTVFVPEMFKYTLNTMNLWFFKTDTLYVVGSRDVGTVTVNGQPASPMTYLTDIYGALSGVAEKLGMDYASLVGDQYRVWMYTNTTSTSDKAVYEIVAYDMNGLAAAPVYAPDEAGNTSNITKDDMTGYYEQKRAEMWSIMESLANRFFSPERFDVEINKTPEGKKTAAIATSEDVEYVVANGEIIDRYITETVVDLSKDGEKTVSRIWVKEVAEEEDELEVTAHDREGVRSESKVSNNGLGNAWGNANGNNGNANGNSGNANKNDGNSNKNNGNSNKNNSNNKNSRW